MQLKVLELFMALKTFCTSLEINVISFESIVHHSYFNIVSCSLWRLVSCIRLILCPAESDDEDDE